MTRPPPRPPAVDPLLGHLAVALHRYVVHARRHRVQLPGEVHRFAELALHLARTSGTASSRPGAPGLDPLIAGAESPVMTEPTLLLRPEDAAVALSVSRRTVERLISSGELPTVQLGRSVRVPRDRLAHYVASLPSRAGTSPEGGDPEMAQSTPTGPASPGYVIRLTDENDDVVELHFDPAPETVTAAEQGRLDRLLDGRVEAWLHRIAHGGVSDTDLQLVAFLAAQRAGVAASGDDLRADWARFLNGPGDLLAWVELPFSTDLVLR